MATDEELATARATIRRLNRRCQQAESKVAKYEKQGAGGSWSSPERQKQAAESDRHMAAVAKQEERKS